ncbi:flowering-promoting factor 1-like [Senna tora]|uniref:Flowering-promoting factor 1-like n=1 Tax=Senna tora TaxID=362788 RepID=A0A834X0X3_9FABA|nr:flowering-promoting factor 1-like [Senna tora]
MSGVWEFKDGVLRLVENLESQKEETNGGKKKVLVHLATGEVVTSYTKLDQILSGLGWEKHKEEGVWVFKNGVVRLVENPGEGVKRETNGRSKRKVLVYLATGDVVSSYTKLHQILIGLGWERYYGGSGDPDLIQFHKYSSIDLLSLPKDFSKFNSIHMYDIVVKNPNVFHVKDADQESSSSTTSS